jgi:hypothetical protein
METLFFPCTLSHSVESYRTHTQKKKKKGLSLSSFLGLKIEELSPCLQVLNTFTAQRIV